MVRNININKKKVMTTETNKEVKITDVLAMLNSGKNRKEIGDELGLTFAQRTELFKHPKLKGVKTKPAMKGFVIVDDTMEPETTAETVFRGEVEETPVSEGEAVDADPVAESDLVQESPAKW